MLNSSVAALGVAGLALTIALTAAPTAAAQDDAPPTWSGEVAAIVHRSCAGCHHAGGAGPMSLLTWDEARPWAKAMAREVAPARCLLGTPRPITDASPTTADWQTKIATP